MRTSTILERLAAPKCLAALVAALALTLLTGAPVFGAPAGAFRVVVDAGHGGRDPGAESSLVPAPEKELTLRLALLTGAALQRRGADVVYTRTDDRYVSLAERASLAGRSGAAAVISIHFNSATEPSVGGAEAWYGSGPKGLELATTVLDALARPLATYGIGVRGTRAGPSLAVLRTSVPATLVEIAYITNPREAPMLAQQQFLASLADALAGGVVRFRESEAAAPVAAASGRNSAGGSPATVSGLYFIAAGDTLRAIAARFRLSVDHLMHLNPLSDPRRLQVGRPLRLDAAPAALSPPAAAPAETGAGAGRARGNSGATYTVASGDTLSGIAGVTGVSVSELMRLNALEQPRLVRAGQVLRLTGAAPLGSAAGSSPNGPSAAPTSKTYTVVGGDTLGELAARHGITLPDLMRWNGLSDPRLIQAGQQLRLAPASDGEKGTSASGTGRYQVRPGDTLSDLAPRFGVTVEALLRANELPDADRLTAGKVLIVPAS